MEYKNKKCQQYMHLVIHGDYKLRMYSFIVDLWDFIMFIYSIHVNTV